MWRTTSLNLGISILEMQRWAKLSLKSFAAEVRTSYHDNESRPSGSGKESGWLSLRGISRSRHRDVGASMVWLERDEQPWSHSAPPHGAGGFTSGEEIICPGVDWWMGQPFRVSHSQQFWDVLVVALITQSPGYDSVSKNFETWKLPFRMFKLFSVS